MRWQVLIPLLAACGCSSQPTTTVSDTARPDATRPDANRPDAVAVTVDADLATSPDADLSTGVVVPVVVTGAAPVERKSFAVWLRSTPPGALAAVDGLPVGVTPVKTSVVQDQRRHDFTFTLAGYAMARYKVRVITNGVVHGIMRRLPDEPGEPAADAGP